MKEQLVDDDLVRRFLLGQVSPQEEGEIAALMFEDPEKFSQLESVEDDLIDEFLQEELSPADKEGFETHFLSQPGRRHNLKLSRALHQHFDKEDAPAVVPVIPVVPLDNRVSVLGLFKISRPALRFSLAAAAVLMVLVIAIWLYVRVRESQQPAPFEARKEQGATPTPSATGVPSIEPSPSLAQGENKNSVPSPQKHEPAPVQAVVLMPFGATRSEVQPLALPTRGANVFVELPLISETRYNSYDATLKSDDGTVLKSWSTLTARRLKTGRGLLINIPLGLLKPQELYRITVNGKSADGTSHEVHRYEFQPRNNP